MSMHCLVDTKYEQYSSLLKTQCNGKCYYFHYTSGFRVGHISTLKKLLEEIILRDSQSDETALPHEVPTRSCLLSHLY